MTTIITHAALAIAAAFFDSLWEGAVIVGFVWLGLRCLPKLGAATRYAIWFCALMGLVLIPALTVRLADRPPDPAIDSAATSAQTSVAINAPAAQPRINAPAAQPRINARRAAPEPASTVSEPAPAAPRTSEIPIPQTLALAAALLWMLVACARGLLLLLDVRDLAAIRRDARLWSTAYDHPVFLSNRVRVPLAAGFLRAAVILPASLVEQLTPDAVETIVIHEVAHLHRYDVWTNALARIAEAFLALNPAAWFVMRRLTMEREIACDDWVVARTGAGDAFAQTLLEMASHPGARVPLAAPSALGSRHSIVVRIERLLDSRPRRLRLSPAALGAALMLLALVAFTLQSVSPVLAYAPQPDVPARLPVTQIAANCATPNRNIRMASFLGMNRRLPGFPQDGLELPDARKLVARLGAANVATFDLTVDAAGRPRKVAVLSAPPYPGMAEHVTRLMMADAYMPALHNCIPVAATIRTGMHFGAPLANASSIVVPVYPKGWSAQFKSACKVPTVQHTGVPAFPASMHDISVDASYSTSVRVHVNAAGAVTNAAVITPSGQRAFDDALLVAAREATYPLTESSGFKQARPGGAPLSWNAAHGSDTYLVCKPLPTDYVWSTTFGRVVPVGPPGMTFLVQGRTVLVKRPY
jgi:TonB family protein